MLKQDQIEGSFIGIGIGDALGLPAETMNLETIRDNIPTVADEYLKSSYQKSHFPGQWSDDMQLTLAVTRSLINSRGFDLDSQAYEHVKEYVQSTMGWGKGTMESVNRIRAGVDPRESGNPYGFGNGVIMKVLPLALYHHSFQTSEDRQLIETSNFARMTHANSVSEVAAALHSRVIQGVIERVEANIEHNGADFLNRILDDALYLEEHYSDDKKEISRRIKQLVENAHQLNDDDTLIDISNNGTAYVVDSLAMSYGIYASTGNTYESLQRAILIGGDTDSNAGVIGGLIGLEHGTSIFPTKLIKGLWSIYEIRSTATSFADFLNLS